MAERPVNTSGSCAGCVMQGTRPIISEIQALVAKTVYQTGKRTADGFDYNRAVLLLAVGEKRAGLKLSAFDAFASRAAKLLGEEGAKPEEENIVTKLSANWGSMMNTMRDSTSTHIAEMLVEGSTMGVNDMLKQMREAENSSVGESALRLARDVCAYEEKIVRDMREAYLR